jgi:hypothetical protein
MATNPPSTNPPANPAPTKEAAIAHLNTQQQEAVSFGVKGTPNTNAYQWVALVVAPLVDVLKQSRDDAKVADACKKAMTVKFSPEACAINKLAKLADDAPRIIIPN